MDKSAIRNFSIEARKILMKSAETEAGFYGVTRKGCKSPIQKGNDFEVYETLAGTENRIYGADIKKRSNLVEAVETLGFDQVIEETAYTWFNRIIAIRFMEVNGYLPTRVRVLSSETGSNTPDIVTQSLDVDLNMTPEELEKVQKAKDENRYDDAFRMLFVKQCNELNAILPGLFEKTDDYMELLLKLSYTSDGVVRMLVDTVAEDNFNVETEGQVEIIGWMYQYYNTELKDDTFAKLKKNVKITKERIPAATQLFTPDWIVRYMVENSVGRVWIEHLRAIDSTIDEKAKADEFGWKYYVPEAEQETEVQEKLVEIRKSFLSLEPKDISCIDPCMGSGHILVYMFDVLMSIYQSEGFSNRDAVFNILENNIRGLDIDRRAYQLSYFALMMKARGYNRLFFRGIQNENDERRLVEPIVFAIEESNDLNRNQLQYFGANLTSTERIEAIKQINELLDLFLDAREYGSVLETCEFDWELLRKFLQIESTNGQISFETYGIENTNIKIRQLIKQAQTMSRKYWAVSTNPPYMAISSGGKKLVDYVNKHFIGGKTDMFAVFIEKCSVYCKENGLIGMITQPSLTSLVSFQKLREKLFQTRQINSFLHMGRGIFGIDFGSVSFVYRNCFLKDYIGNYFKLYKKTFQYINPDDIEKLFLYAKTGILQKYIFELYETETGINIKSGYEEGDQLFYKSKQDKFMLVPGCPFAYAMHEKMINCFSEGLLGDKFITREGMATAGNEDFLRLWYEVKLNDIAFNCESNDEAMNTHKRWFPYNKGGDYRKWFGNNDYVVNWKNDGEIIRNNKDIETGRIRSHNYNGEYAFKKGLTWSSISSGDISVRWSDQGFLFDSKGAKGFAEDDRKMYAIQGLINSTVAMKYLEFFSPTMDFKVGDIVLLPLCKKIFESEELVNLVKENIQILKDDWDTRETSWSFKRHPLLKHVLPTLVDTTSQFIHERNVIIQKLKENEEKINELLVEMYGLVGVVNTKVFDDKLSMTKISENSIIKSLISYAVGCMLGRYSLEREGVVYISDNCDTKKYSAYFPDDDGIIPITDEEYFTDDIVTRFTEFVAQVFGKEYLEKNIDFIANVLGNKGKSSRDKIRNYFINDFYKDHCNTYSITGSGKRPIYWSFSSGKENGFKCLIYVHRYTKDTLNLIRSEYLHKAEDAVENALKNSEYVIQTSSSAVEKAKATKDRDKYVKQLNEMRIYYQALSHLAIQKIEIDLDNGVKNNYQLFQGIEVIVDGGKKQKVDLLAKI